MITKLPDLTKAAKLLSIQAQLEKISTETTFGLAIRIALKKNDLKRTIEMIRDQVGDNYILVAGLIGEDLLNKIIEL